MNHDPAPKERVVLSPEQESAVKETTALLDNARTEMLVEIKISFETSLRCLEYLAYLSPAQREALARWFEREQHSARLPPPPYAAAFINLLDAYAKAIRLFSDPILGPKVLLP